VRLLSQALASRFRIDPGCAWVNYVRVHDDIGWTFSDDDAALLGINGYDHRRFLNEFYRGRFPGSFARGLPFQENPKTGDCRISGTCASLAGLEKALEAEGSAEAKLAIRRILLIHGVILTVGGIPLLYLGDEIGTPNDYSYQEDPAHQQDSRWVHRPKSNWERYTKRNDPDTIEGKVFLGLKNLIELRKGYSVFSGGELETIPTGNDHVLGFMRIRGADRALILANFSEVPQTIASPVLGNHFMKEKIPVHGKSHIRSRKNLQIAPLDFLVFIAK
jgi:amylosucrase